MSWTPPTLPALVAPTTTNLPTGYMRPPLYIPGYFSLAAVKKIVVRGGAGDDTIVINSSIPADVSGEDGNDVVYGSFANDHLDGGHGNDQLHAQPGNDALPGHAGN